MSSAISRGALVGPKGDDGDDGICLVYYWNGSSFDVKPAARVFIAPASASSAVAAMTPVAGDLWEVVP